ncbi:hypothetical protein H4582DRAFT_2063990 [Lactarius indigo]|nr:hypothetical protein H4582DRAFT_2063990 [Lactarius indigo]
MIIRHMQSWWLACTLMLCCRECLMRIGGDGDVITCVTRGQCRGIGSAISNGGKGDRKLARRTWLVTGRDHHEAVTTALCRHASTFARPARTLDPARGSSSACRHRCDLHRRSVTVGMSAGAVMGQLMLLRTRPIVEPSALAVGRGIGGRLELRGVDPVDVHVPRDEAANIDSIALEGCQWQSDKLTLYHVLRVQHGDSEGSLDKMLDTRPVTGGVDVDGKAGEEEGSVNGDQGSSRSIWPEDGAGDRLRGTVNGSGIQILPEECLVVPGKLVFAMRSRKTKDSTFMAVKTLPPWNVAWSQLARSQPKPALQKPDQAGPRRRPGTAQGSGFKFGRPLARPAAPAFIFGAVCL